MRRDVRIVSLVHKETDNSKQEPDKNHFYIHAAKQKAGKQKINNQIAERHVNGRRTKHFGNRGKKSSMKAIYFRAPYGRFCGEIRYPA